MQRADYSDDRRPSADLQPPLPGLGFDSGGAGGSNLLPPLSPPASQDREQPSSRAAQNRESTRSGVAPFAADLIEARLEPQPFRSLSAVEIASAALGRPPDGAEEWVDEFQYEVMRPWIETLHKTYPAWVYFVRADSRGPVKIGFSVEPDKRLSTLRRQHELDLYIDAMMPGNITVERRLHERFAHARLEGEWFRGDTPGLAQLIVGANHFYGFPWDWESSESQEVLKWLPIPELASERVA